MGSLEVFICVFVSYGISENKIDYFPHNFKKEELFKPSNLKYKISQEEIATSDRGYSGTGRQKKGIRVQKN